MHPTTVNREDFQQLWTNLPKAFRDTHPIPLGGDRARFAAWGSAVHEDSENAIVAILDTSTAYLARGDRAAGNETAAQARPFRRIMTYLSECDPMNHPCDECGAEPRERCRPMCTAPDEQEVNGDALNNA